MRPGEKMMHNLAPYVCWGLGAVALALGVNSLSEGYASKQWEQTSAVVTDAGIRIRDRSTQLKKKYIPQVQYKYVVDGQPHVSDRIHTTTIFTSRKFKRRSEAEKWLEDYPVGGEITIYYDPEDARQSVIINGNSAFSYFIPALGAGLILTGFTIKRRKNN